MILAVVIVNAVIGFVQEGRAEQAMEAIRGILAPRSAVLRNGRRQNVDAADLVPGDIVLLEAGDKVPADLRLLLRSASSPPAWAQEQTDHAPEDRLVDEIVPSIHALIRAE